MTEQQQQPPTGQIGEPEDECVQLRAQVQAMMAVVKAAQICSDCGGVGKVKPCRDGACHARLSKALAALDLQQHS
jgi:hypothetical protein